MQLWTILSVSLLPVIMEIALIGHTCGNGTGEGLLIGVLEVAPKGDAAGNGSDLDVLPFELAGDVEDGGIALHRGADTHDDLPDLFFLAAADQVVDGQVFRTNAIHG